MENFVEQEADSSTGWLQPFLDLSGPDPDSSQPTMEDTVGYGDRQPLDTQHKVPGSSRGRRGSRPHSTPLTLKWLQENYERADGVCIPRSTLYYHYLDFCQAGDTTPVNAASFGKIIRQQFPLITTRRLGTRGQSKYHYYGIAVKDTSVYYELVYSAKSAQTTNEHKKELPKQVVTYSPRAKLGTLLPEFPAVSQIVLPAEVEESKVVTFLMMYRTHCQRLLDTVIRASFDEVQTFLLHFWQGVPSHLTSILASDVMVKVIGVCDSILYKAVAGVLMPTVLQALPDSLTAVIRTFGRQLEDWLRSALHGLPDVLTTTKLDIARRFSQVLKRQISLNHLVQASRTVVNSQEMMTQLLTDWLSIDLGSILKQTLYTMEQDAGRENKAIVHMCTEFEKLLEEQSPMDSYIDWLDNMVDSCVVKASLTSPGSLRAVARQFLLMWSCFGTRLVRDMTLHNAPSFGSFHLLHLMFDDYVLYKVEALHAEERVNDLLKLLRGEKIECEFDPALPDPVLASQSLSASPWKHDGLLAGAATLSDSSGRSDFRHNSVLVSSGGGEGGVSMFDYDIQSDQFFSSDEDSLDSPPPASDTSHSGLTSRLGNGYQTGVVGPSVSNAPSLTISGVGGHACAGGIRAPNSVQPQELFSDRMNQPSHQQQLYYSSQHHRLQQQQQEEKPPQQQQPQLQPQSTALDSQINQGYVGSVYHQQQPLQYHHLHHHPRLQHPQNSGANFSFHDGSVNSQHHFRSDPVMSSQLKQQTFSPQLTWINGSNIQPNTQFGNTCGGHVWPTQHQANPGSVGNLPGSVIPLSVGQTQAPGLTTTWLKHHPGHPGSEMAAAHFSSNPTPSAFRPGLTQ